MPYDALRRLTVGTLLTLCIAAPVAAQPAVRHAPRRTVVRADDAHGLVLWSKRPAGRVRGSVLLLHGRTWSALPNFDLQVPGQQVSLMDAMVKRGYAVYALDQRGYGATPRDSSGFITPARAARDALEVLDWIASHERAGRRPALFGYSQGSLTAMLAAQGAPASMSALVLYGFPLDVNATMPTSAVAEPTQPERRATTIAGAEEDFITPESTPRGVKEAYARAAVAADPVRTDWRGEREFLTLDPSALRVPVLVINGERDPHATRARLGAFMARVTGVDRQWVVLAHADHAAHLERQPEFADALASFLGALPHP
jgi:pimeloyl-ACP methyl ester carboxylesterase